MRTFLAGTSGAAWVGRAGAMILAGLTCVAHGRPLPGNLGLGTDCLLMARERQFGQRVVSTPLSHSGCSKAVAQDL